MLRPLNSGKFSYGHNSSSRTAAFSLYFPFRPSCEGQIDHTTDHTDLSMSRKRPKRPQPNRSVPSKADDSLKKAELDPQANLKWWREAVESVVVAIILAFLFRTFEAEAFVIPTGSMAPTLQGKHKDLECEKCGHWYRTGSSDKAPEGMVQRTTCPMCRHTSDIGFQNRGHGQYPVATDSSFTGDRILVNKFAYELDDPKRWDIIVFKFPGEARQNYIKRLIGLPGEVIRIEHGDIYTTQTDWNGFRIARKPPRKLPAMLQLVHDTHFVAKQLVEAGWPTPGRWHADDPAAWEIAGDGRTHGLAGSPDADRWIRYRHVVPTQYDWATIEQGQLPSGLDQRPGQLINDFYAYNAYVGHESRAKSAQGHPYGHPVNYVTDEKFGLHWVGDLALECDLEVVSGQGELLLDLVEAGRHYTCRIDTATGRATLAINGGREAFRQDVQGKPVVTITGQTSVRKPGKYRVRFANVDDELNLWIDNRLCRFDAPARYVPPTDSQPKWSPEDPGDAAPLGVGGRGIDLRIDRLRVLRDVYYVAAQGSGVTNDYDHSKLGPEFTQWETWSSIQEVFANPRSWSTTALFGARRHVDFPLEEDQFFPLGDNSPQSLDGRLWTPSSERFVHRDLLVGKAFFIYWPHPWYVKIPGETKLPIIPNVRKMGWIR